MTPEGRQDLAAVIAKIREEASKLDRQLTGGFHAQRLRTWADRLALLLAEAQLQQVQENTEVTRVEAMGNSKDNPTASEHETTPATVTPNQVSNGVYYVVWPGDPEATGPYRSSTGRIDIFSTKRQAESFWKRNIADQDAKVFPVKLRKLQSLAALPETSAIPQQEKEKDDQDDTRVVDSQYDPPSARPLATASENQATPATVTPTQVSPEPPPRRVTPPRNWSPPHPAGCACDVCDTVRTYQSPPPGDDASREAAKRMSVRGPSPTTAEWLAKQLEIHGYKALPCWRCGREGAMDVHDLHALLLSLEAARDHLRARLHQLVEFWRELSRAKDWSEATQLQQCAADLLAVLTEPEEKK